MPPMATCPLQGYSRLYPANNNTHVEFPTANTLFRLKNVYWVIATNFISAAMPMGCSYGYKCPVPDIIHVRSLLRCHLEAGVILPIWRLFKRLSSFMQPVLEPIVPMLPSSTTPTEQITDALERLPTRLLSGTNLQILLGFASPKVTDTLECSV